MDTTVHASAADRAYRHVKSAILGRSFPAGEFITEGGVSDEIGVSRTPVREAFLRLEAEGLLRLFPKKGALVLGLSAADADDVLEARALIETWAAGKVTGTHPSDQPNDQLIAELELLLADMRAAREAGDPQALMLADRSFHAAIVAAAGNGVLERIYGSLRERQLLIGVTSLRISPERMRTSVDEHTALLDALRAGDRSRLRTLARTHVEHAGKHLRAGR